MDDIVIYTSPSCPYCRMALQLLREKQARFREVNVDGDEGQRRWLREVTGRTTVPQVFIEGKPVGGYTDLVALDRAGKLDALLARA